METKIAQEILINASLISHDTITEIFEFIIDHNLNIKDSIKIKNFPKRDVQPIADPKNNLNGMLFELNHVRVNPKLNNEEIIKNVVAKLNEVGVNVTEPPSQNDVSICFKPLGAINSSVRFYVNDDDSLVFLSPMQPKLVCYNT